MNRKLKMGMLIASAFLTFTSCNGQTAGCCGSKSKSCSHSCSSGKDKSTKVTNEAIETKVTFFKGSYAEALELAKKENKKVFIDAYAVWCEPCKMLDKNTFTNQTVINYLNSNYINFKFDVEKGEGKTLAQKLNITEYPTLIEVENNGKISKKVVGYKNSEKLIKWLNK